MNMRWIWLLCAATIFTWTGCSSHQDELEPPPADAAINNNAPGAQNAPPAPANLYVPRPALLKGRRS